jgi:hypothetical protein
MDRFRNSSAKLPHTPCYIYIYKFKNSKRDAFKYSKVVFTSFWFFENVALLLKCFKFNSAKQCRISLATLISSCSNTGSIRDDLYWTSKENILELIELSSINKVSLVKVSFWRKTGSVRDDPYWISRKNSLELIELSSINKVSLVQVSSCSNTGSIRDDPYWISRKNSLELLELSSINKVRLV